MLRERRRYFRHPVKMPVAVVLGEKQLQATATNISEGGIAISTHKALPKDAKPRLQFTLPGTTLSFDLDAEVAWADLNGGVGLRFPNVPKVSQELIEGWLNAQLEQSATGKEQPAPAASSSVH